MIFKPLRIGADGLSPLCGFYVFEIYHAFPGGFQAHGVAVVFDKSVYKINMRIQILYPKHVVFVPDAEVAGFIIFHQRFDYRLLVFIFSNFSGFFKPVNDLLNGLAVQTAHFVNLFGNYAVFLYQFAVQSERNQGVGPVNHCIAFQACIKSFCLLFGNAFVEIAG
ncbi:hypothetical protein DSECCO2_566620 [anaerobic digester metagenome]